MSEEIIKVLDNLAQRFGIAIDWTNQNVMPYIQELMGRFIVYKNAQAIMWIIISLIAVISSTVVCIKLHKYKVKNKIDEYDDEMIWIWLGYNCAGFIILGFIIAFFCNMNGLMQNIFMPEMTILNYIKDFM